MTKFKHRWGGNSLELGCIIADNLTGLIQAAKELGYNGWDGHEQANILQWLTVSCCNDKSRVIPTSKGFEVVPKPEYAKAMSRYYQDKKRFWPDGRTFAKGRYMVVFLCADSLVLFATDEFMESELSEHPFQMGSDILEDVICNSELEYRFNPEWSDEFVLNGDTYFDNQYAVRCWIETLHSKGYVVFDKWRN